ncbi:hypothetical protein P4S93_12860 [Aneurinibacillus thermoaerophilus]|uniref:YgiT-type zinc finger domain-containing protein n=1 Tax=Aneurinibacillus thermoaerophilus TaxID=143495 RepID=A0A1G8CJK6_ANETH|nr:MULTISPECIES: hypothetical protein [Aneurinibacillus]AMA71937.1 hypothetical protein ACH33_03170 [Aneurinibacillus sp. XH2]MED0675511.1 hypothetical protein [Aneurinibacillus thermoaerophilus]MED0680278.1 hypothetical protein [Aneurinibacillus thermoaerophilus]MED0758723.1 hypothetical protein [Aneurinibacillus thermoaerophilus]MED0761655.1 hypothetical protein [Aneurinibacillus thermoaerophilus]
MSFCCGASMIGALGSLRHVKTQIHNVPILYCPVCNRIDVHPEIEEEYDILSEYAQADLAPEVDFREYVTGEHVERIFENCVSIDDGNISYILRSQIDNALDLMSVAKQLDDEEWSNELKRRLNKLSKRLIRWEAQSNKTLP